jgi:hypothetical protein
MRDSLEHIKQFRIKHPFLDYGDDFNGCAYIDNPFPSRKSLFVVFSNGNNWDHVSVSLVNQKMPTWDEMCFVKNIFFNEEECVVQFHPKESEYINNHKACLHLWRYQSGEFPCPDKIMVGL